MAGSTTVTALSGRVNPAAARRPDVVRLLQTPLTPTLLGERLTLDFYARNGFRFLSLPAWVDSDVLAARWQAYRSLVRLDLGRALAARTATVSDGHVDAQAALDAVSKLEDPRHRFVAELLWLHVSDREIQALRKEGGLAMPGALRMLSPDGATGPARIQRLHALAVASHCLALEKELEYLDQGAPMPAGVWEAAIKNWRELLAADGFWTYMSARVAKLDDPRLQGEDVARAHTELAAVILSVHEALAEKYAAGQRFPDCVRHLRLIMQSGFGDAVVHAATWNTARKVAGARLEDLLRRTTEAFDGVKDRVDRGRFEVLAGPLIHEAREIHALLSRRLEVPDQFLTESTFDQIAEKIHGGVNGKIKYEGDQRERNILYSTLLNTRLLALPLSSVLRRKIETSIRDDSRVLYSRFGLDIAACPDPTKCFFLDGEEADPESSLLVDVHRVTNRQVNVDRARGTGGVRVSYESGKILIPRSALAARVKRGAVNVQIPEAEYTPRQHAAAAEIRDLEQQAKTTLAALERERDAAIGQEEHRAEAEAQAIAKRNQARQAEAETGLARVRKSQQTQLSAAERRIEEQRAQVEAEHAPPVQAAREMEKRSREMFAGFKGFLKLEAPAMVVSSAVFWQLWGDMGGLAIVLGSTAGILLGRIVRPMVTGRGERRLLRAQQARDAALAECNSAWESRKREIESAYAPQRKPMEDFLAGMAREEAAVRQPSKKRVEALRAEYDKKKQEISAGFDARIKKLRSELVKTGTVKDLSEKVKFPAYRAARAKGFGDGSEPSSYEMQMTEAEKTQARVQLMLFR
jgi:hypothetical protein